MESQLALLAIQIASLTGDIVARDQKITADAENIKALQKAIEQLKAENEKLTKAAAKKA